MDINIRHDDVINNSSILAHHHKHTLFCISKPKAHMNKDITTVEDIQSLINTFYDKVKKDEVISYFFTEVIPVDWDAHLPVMYRFWESILLDNPVYQDNAMAKHFHIHEKSPMETKHFDRWLELFHETVDELFSGEIADKAKARSSSIAKLMEYQMKG